MKVKITKASDWDFKEMREISTIKELQQIQEDFESEMIVKFIDKQEQQEEDCEISVIIYDDYVE